MRTKTNENPFNDLLLSPMGKPNFVVGDVMMFAPKYNVKRADADEFQREAKRFREFHWLSAEHTQTHLIDNLMINVPGGRMAEGIGTRRC